MIDGFEHRPQVAGLAKDAAVLDDEGDAGFARAIGQRREPLAELVGGCARALARRRERADDLEPPAAQRLAYLDRALELLDVFGALSPGGEGRGETDTGHFDAGQRGRFHGDFDAVVAELRGAGEIVLGGAE